MNLRTIIYCRRLHPLVVWTIGLIVTTISQEGLAGDKSPARRPNILFCISDDQAWPYASAYGCRTVETPAFDRVARQGVLFTNAFCASPGCAPSRAALLTGRNCWELREAGTHASSFPKDLQVYPELLEAAGYHVGLTGKGWGPGNWEIGGRPRNPAGPDYSKLKTKGVPEGIQNTDYAGNFAEFYRDKPKGRPFCFWFGCKEPHRAFLAGAGEKAGKKLRDVEVPPFLPDAVEVRSDILDYCVEIEWFDQHLGRMLNFLEEAGELENTIVVATGDNGMPFPRAKANNYDAGTHAPLAICWPAKIPGARTVNDLVSLIDLAPTFLTAAGLKPLAEMTGKSLYDLLTSTKQGQIDPERSRVFFSRERHSSARYENLGYPSRAMRTADYLYIRNFAPDRWPAGDPPGYYDIDGSPTKSLLIERRDDANFGRYLHLAVDKRPAEELYDVRNDPGNLKNLAGDAKYAEVQQRLRGEMNAYLTSTKDPRVLGNGDIFESYPRYSPIRKFDKPGSGD